MKLKETIVALIGVTALSCGWAAPIVSNVRMQQIEGTKQVQITYDVADNFNTSLWVSVSITDNGSTLPVNTITGDVNRILSPGVGKSMVWDAGKDWNGHFTDKAKAKIRAFYPKYMRIRFNGAHKEDEFTVDYLDEATYSYQTGWKWSTPEKSYYLILRRVEGGTFMMGSPDSELCRSDNEDLHQVTISRPFYIGVSEVTKSQWAYVKGQAQPSSSTYYPQEVSYAGIRGSNVGTNWPASSDVDATSFLGILRRKTGINSFDLPTEAMWEYACRAGTTTAFNNGKDITSTNYQHEAIRDLCYLSGTAVYSASEVGSYYSNDWNLYDMHGNYAEWCLDWYQENLGGESTVDPRGPSSGSLGRVLRGGGSYSYQKACNCRSASRTHGEPSKSYLSIGSYNYSAGFRVVCFPEQ